MAGGGSGWWRNSSRNSSRGSWGSSSQRRGRIRRVQVIRILNGSPFGSSHIALLFLVAVASSRPVATHGSETHQNSMLYCLAARILMSSWPTSATVPRNIPHFLFKLPAALRYPPILQNAR